MKLFISCSHDDKNYVHELAQLLRDEAQHDVWIDRRLVGADLWWDTILDRIEDCECYAMVLTPLSVESMFCTAEVAYAQELKKPVLPLLLKPCEIPVSLKRIQCTDISDVLLSKALTRCMQALTRVEVRMIKGEYPAPETLPLRPNPPEAKSSQHVYEMFADAEEAASQHRLKIAQALYQKVMKVDPEGLGTAAAELYAQVTREFDCETAYSNIVHLVEKELLSGARAAWRDYVNTRRCADYDPNGYARTLSDDSPQQNSSKSKSKNATKSSIGSVSSSNPTTQRQYTDVLPNPNKIRPPFLITIQVELTGDRQKDRLRLEKLKNQLIQYPGNDQFRFLVNESANSQKIYTMDFPGETTCYDENVISLLEEKKKKKLIHSVKIDLLEK